jgi:hypothetical protein
VFTGHYAISGGLYSPADGGLGRILEFEYCSKSLANVYMGMWRHLSAATRPTELDEFEEYSNALWNYKFTHTHIKPEVTILLEYPLHAFDDDHTKRDRYIVNIRRCLKEGDFTLGPFETMVKTGEVNFTAHKELDD